MFDFDGSTAQDDDQSMSEVTHADMAPAGISCGFELEYFPDAPVLALNVYHGDRWTQMHWISPAELDLLCARWQHIKNA